MARLRSWTLGLLLVTLTATLPSSSAYVPPSGRVFRGAVDAASALNRRRRQQQQQQQQHHNHHHHGTSTPHPGRRSGHRAAAEGNGGDDSSTPTPVSAPSTARAADEHQRNADREGTRAKRTAAAVCPDCDLCDGSGRIAGGLGAVLPWLPVKAYRPCPNFIDRGGTYQRSGQGLDEIAFGRDSTYSGGGPN
jgi:hypothetical protein